MQQSLNFPEVQLEPLFEAFQVRFKVLLLLCIRLSCDHQTGALPTDFTLTELHPNGCTAHPEAMFFLNVAL